MQDGRYYVAKHNCGVVRFLSRPTIGDVSDFLEECICKERENPITLLDKDNHHLLLFIFLLLLPATPTSPPNTSNLFPNRDSN